MGDDRHRAGGQRGRLGRLELALGAGALAGLALPPLGLPPLLWLALAMLWGLAGHPPMAGAPAGLLWGLAAVLVSHRWLLWLHPLDWVGVPAPLSLPLCLLLWLLCGLVAGLLVQLWLVLVRWADPLRASTALVGACAWGLAEVGLARGPLFWIGLGSASLPGDRPLAGLAAYGGAGLLAAVQVLLGWGLWRLVHGPGGRRGWLALVAALLVGSHGLGLLALAEAATDEPNAPFDGAPPAPLTRERLLLLQPAIPTRRKFEAEQQLRLLDQLLDSERRAARLPPALQVHSLILPEGALASGQPLPEPAPVEVLSGGFRPEGEELRSSLLRFAPGDRDPVGWLDKHRVVPLGEWVPLAGLARWSGLSAVGGIEPGATSRLLSRPGGAIAVAICYEIADGTALARASREGALWLLATANLDPYPALLRQQFLALARLRAIESGRWLVSVANTGPSGVVDGAGRLRNLLPEAASHSGLVSVQQRRRLTPYARWGEAPLLGLLALGLVGRMVSRLGRRSRSLTLWPTTRS